MESASTLLALVYLLGQVHGSFPDDFYELVTNMEELGNNDWSLFYIG